jgi:hypothetical protein
MSYTRFFLDNTHAMLLILAVLIVYFYFSRQQGELGQYEQAATGIFLIVSLLHMQFAGCGWFYRYEAYLVASGLLILAVMLKSHASGKAWQGMPLARVAALLLLAVLLVCPLIKRAGGALVRVPQAAANIYEQQYQMGLFLKKYYAGCTVFANDIGAINYLADIRCLDLWGLGSIEIARKMLAHQVGAEFLSSIGKRNDAKMAIIYDEGLRAKGRLPAEWRKVADWSIGSNVICGGDKVAFYATDPAYQDTLRANLAAFAPSLPSAVNVKMCDQ